LRDAYFNYVYAPLFDRRGAVDGILVCAFDVTGPGRARQALQESEKQFHTLAATLPLLAWDSEPDGRIPSYKRRWFQYHRTSPEERQAWWQSIHPSDDPAWILEKWKSALASGEPWEDEFRLRRHDGTFRWFLSRAIPLRDARGRIVRWFGTNVDI